MGMDSGHPREGTQQCLAHVECFVILPQDLGRREFLKFIFLSTQYKDIRSRRWVRFWLGLSIFVDKGLNLLQVLLSL